MGLQQIQKFLVCQTLQHFVDSKKLHSLIPGFGRKKKERENFMQPVSLPLVTSDTGNISMSLWLSGFYCVSRDPFSEEMVLGLGMEGGEGFKEVKGGGRVLETWRWACTWSGLGNNEFDGGGVWEGEARLVRARDTWLLSCILMSSLTSGTCSILSHSF